MTQDVAQHHILETSNIAGGIFGDNLFVPTQVAMHAAEQNADLVEPVSLIADELTDLALNASHNGASARQSASKINDSLVLAFLSLGYMIFDHSVYTSFRKNVRGAVIDSINAPDAISELRELLMLPRHSRGLSYKHHILALHDAVNLEPVPSHIRLNDLLRSTVGHITSFGADARDGSMLINGVEYVIVHREHDNGTSFQITRGIHGASTEILHTQPYTKIATR
ncbi:hypothetical protein HOI83_01775 [Candidatus Uhrbacteria bacterium]|jgi:hypothetical protein|nr:hypothetical protein [Candidatus Uhrbacteria bacterium]